MSDGASARDRRDAVSIRKLAAVMDRLRPLHRKLGKPRPGDWLASHPEPGQTFQQYVASSPVMPRGKRRVIVIQPIGEFAGASRKILDLTADFMGRYLNRPVRVMEGLPLSRIPESARRVHPSWGDKQILTGYVLDKVLKPNLPNDAAAMLALTTSDLWPGPGWNFVFGQASLRDRVGVWSIYRNGDPDQNDASFRLCLLRTLKTATHETGHMFSMWHCTAYACNMCGSNHRQESDRRPLACCPECMAKICWATQTEPADRYERLMAFCREHGLKNEAAAYERLLSALRGR